MAKPKFTCEPCAMSMHPNCRESHLAGRTHKKNAGTIPASLPVTAESIASPANSHLEPGRYTRKSSKSSSAKTANNPVPSSSASHDHAHPNWFCDVCQRSMAFASQQAHLEGGRHARALRREAKSSPPASGAPKIVFKVTWQCPQCKKTIPKVRRDVHLALHEPKRIKKGKGKAGHPRSFHHSGDPDDSDPSLSDDDGRGHGGAGPSRRQGKKRDSDWELSYEDGLSILHDIDTQWGMIPGGGAYKESNHYYGPSMYDYY